MPPEYCLLSDIADIIVGFPFESEQFNTDEKGVKLVRGMNVTTGNFRWGEDSRWWSNLTPDLEPYYLRTDDIIIGMDGSRVGKNYAKVQESDLPLLLVQRVACIRAKEGINQNYLWACIASASFEEYVDLVKTGTTIPHISGRQIGEFPVPKLDQNVQNIIGDISRLLDSKIYLNQKINDNLQEQINAIFTKSIESSNGKAIRFGSLVKIGSGGTPKTSVVDYWGGDIPFFSPKDVSGLYVSSTEKNITKLGLDNCNSGHYPRNTTFITARGTVGKIALAACDMAMNQSCYAIIATAAGHEYYVHQLSLYAVRSIKQKSNGAVFDAINATDITEEMVPDLSEDKIASFEKEVTPLYEMVWANDKEIRTLSGVRDYLLPKMMSGEIDVSTLEIPN